MVLWHYAHYPAWRPAPSRGVFARCPDPMHELACGAETLVTSAPCNDDPTTAIDETQGSGVPGQGFSPQLARGRDSNPIADSALPAESFGPEIVKGTVI